MQTHLFTLIAIETAGVWNSQEREFITELGKRITTVTGEVRETSYIFQQVSVSIQRGNMLSFIGSFTTDRLNTKNNNSNYIDDNNNINN